MYPQDVLLLGQAGLRLRLGSTSICIDPYLTDSVAERFGEEFRRVFPAPVRPEELRPVQWLMLTHAHADHTDLSTLLPMVSANPDIRIMAPYESREILIAAGFPRSHLIQPTSGWTTLSDGVQVRAVPAAHTALETNSHGEWRYVGYLIRWNGCLIYHSGDTIPHPALIESVTADGSPDWAFLPVNERNYFRDAKDIIGNMTIREAFQLADVIGARRVVPIHWDLFALNSAHPEEIALIHRLGRHRFELLFHHAGESVPLVATPSE